MVVTLIADNFCVLSVIEESMLLLLLGLFNAVIVHAELAGYLCQCWWHE